MERESETSQSQSISTHQERSLPDREIFQAIDLLFNAFPKFKISAEEKPKTALLYAESLKGYEPVKVRQAVDHIIRTLKFFPSIAEVIQATRPVADMTDPDRMRHTRLHASMCLGMDDAEVDVYLEGNHLTRYDIDIPYLKAYIAKAEATRNRELARQWPQVYTPEGKIEQNNSPTKEKLR